MGDVQVCSPRSNGVAAEDHLFGSLSSSYSSSCSPPLQPTNPDPSSIGPDSWAWAEDTTRHIVCRIQPTVAGEQKRKDVIDYVQRLIRCCVGCEVFPYGSVPLKTYLPDGDIDLTALSTPNVEETLPSDVCAVLEREEQNEAAEYEVKDVQFIDAEVKLVKCLVQDIVVDISFNQLGGLCTLCFLEQIDCLIGKDHLFKRSIILIKAWCYYESRILGAHHGLISTYALETLVLYIFHLFHSSINGPLAVLYRFLDYFSKFDWDNYCISLNGPVCKSSLPDIVAEVPENGRNDLLLSEEFLKNCLDMFSVPSRGNETNSRAFSLKHLNIIDPLKENNNLGRSVHRGNFYRIRSAFKYGARKLGQILLLQREIMADELNNFFRNTLYRHSIKCRAGGQHVVPTCVATCSGPSSLPSGTNVCSEDNLQLLVGLSNDKISGMEDSSTLIIKNKPKGYSVKVVSSQAVSELDCPANGNAVSGYHLYGDAKEFASSGLLGFRIATDTSDSWSCDFGTSLLGKSCDAAHFYFPGLTAENETTENGHLYQKMPYDSDTGKDLGSVLRLDPKVNNLIACNSIYLHSNHENVASNGSIIFTPVTNTLEHLSHGFGESDLVGISGSPEVFESLLDLSGDYDSHVRSLLYGQSCHGYALSAPIVPCPPISPPQFRNKNLWNTVHHSLQLKQNLHSQMNKNGAVFGPSYPLNHPTPFSAFNSEEKQKLRGIGTYFPNTDFRPHMDRPSLTKGKNQVAWTHGQLQKHTCNKGSATATPDMKLFEEGSHKVSKAQFPVLGCGKSGSSNSHQSQPSLLGSPHANGSSLSFERIEFGSLGHLPLGVPSTEESSHPDSGTSCPCPCKSTLGLVAPAVQVPRPVLGNNPERVAGQSYHLKDDDFPPLSV